MFSVFTNAGSCVSNENSERGIQKQKKNAKKTERLTETHLFYGLKYMYLLVTRFTKSTEQFSISSNFNFSLEFV